MTITVRKMQLTHIEAVHHVATKSWHAWGRFFIQLTTQVIRISRIAVLKTIDKYSAV